MKIRTRIARLRCRSDSRRSGPDCGSDLSAPQPAGRPGQAHQSVDWSVRHAPRRSRRAQASGLPGEAPTCPHATRVGGPSRKGGGDTKSYADHLGHGGQDLPDREAAIGWPARRVRALPVAPMPVSTERGLHSPPRMGQQYALPSGWRGRERITFRMPAERRIHTMNELTGPSCVPFPRPISTGAQHGH